MSNEKNIVFLDLDGPAFPYAVIRYHPDNSKPYPGDFDMGETITYWKMCERFRHLWEKLSNTRDFSVVISSSWRKYYNKEACFNELFTVNGLTLNLHSDWKTADLRAATSSIYTSSYDTTCARATEINEWLTRHQEIKDYVILDDPESGFSLYSDGEGWDKKFDHMKNHIVMVDVDSGFSSENIRRALTLTKSWIK